MKEKSPASQPLTVVYNANTQAREDAAVLNAVADSVKFSWRNFHLKHDFETIYKWMEKHYADDLWQNDDDAKQSLKDTILLAQEGGVSDLYICHHKQEMLAYAELTKASFDDLGLEYTAEEGDYILRLLEHPSKTFTNKSYIKLLQSCLYHCFRKKEIKRIVLETSGNSFAYAILQANFQFLGTAKMRGLTKNLYSFDRKQPSVAPMSN